MSYKTSYNISKNHTFNWLHQCNLNKNQYHQCRFSTKTYAQEKTFKHLWKIVDLEMKTGSVKHIFEAVQTRILQFYLKQGKLLALSLCD